MIINQLIENLDMDFIYELLVDSFGGLAVRKIPFLLLSISSSFILNLLLIFWQKRNSWQMDTIFQRNILFIIIVFTTLGILLVINPIIGIGSSIPISFLFLKYIGNKKIQNLSSTLLVCLVSLICGSGMLVIAGIIFLISMIITYLVRDKTKSN